ncbi:MAG: hypothetical protein FK730_05085 [Asgard group archaeon]|nr:hypothetical protein [Asgard group archaeon]
MARRTSLYRAAEVLAIIAGILGIVLSILGFISGIAVEGWIFLGGFGTEAFWAIIAIVFSVLVLLVGLGSIFTDIQVLVLGILVIVFSIFIPGIALILGIISGVLFIVDGVK